jgi:hypothetical protein
VGNGEGCLIKLGQKNVGKNLHLFRAVLFGDFWKKTIANPTGLIFDYPGEML